MRTILRKVVIILAVVALMFSVLAVTAFSGGGKPKPPPECEVICIEMPPPIFVHCMIYCPPLEE